MLDDLLFWIKLCKKRIFEWKIYQKVDREPCKEALVSRVHDFDQSFFEFESGKEKNLLHLVDDRFGLTRRKKSKT